MPVWASYQWPCSLTRVSWGSLSGTALDPTLGPLHLILNLFNLVRDVDHLGGECSLPGELLFNQVDCVHLAQMRRVFGRPVHK
jgi:hypothetical protein